MREAISGFFFLGLSLLVVWESLRMGTGTMKEPGAGFLSLCAGLMLAVFAIVLIIRGWRGWKSDAKVPRESHSGPTIVALVALFLYSLSMETIGFVAATFLLMAVLFHLAERRPWWKTLGISAIVTAVAYVLFGIVLKVYFPTGLFGI